jgi:hypothetical protein
MYQASAAPEKYYFSFPATGEYAAVCVWESEETLREFRESELLRDIPAAYQIQGAPQFEPAEVVQVLHPIADLPQGAPTRTGPADLGGPWSLTLKGGRDPSSQVNQAVPAQKTR